MKFLFCFELHQEAAQWDTAILNARAILAECGIAAMDWRRSIVVPCAIGNAMNMIAKTAIRGTSEDATMEELI